MSKLKSELTINNKKVEVEFYSKGICIFKPKKDVPKTWKFISYCKHTFGSNYLSNYGKIYQTKTKTLVMETYHDWCFRPYYPKFKYIE